MKTTDKTLSTVTLYLIATGVLLTGVAYYYLFRAPVVAYGWFGMGAHERLPAYGVVVLDALPSFVHVLAFSLLTWLVLDRRYALWSVGFWTGVNLLFEAGQAVPVAYLHALPKLLQRYFGNGTFSIADIIAIFLAAFVALKIMKSQS